MSPSEEPSDPNPKRVVIGIYGVSGCGKSFLLNQLRNKLNKDLYSFHEGSEVIASLVPGGLEEFQQADPQTKEMWRRRAMESIANDNQPGQSGQYQTAVVAGHFMFWPNEADPAGEVVFTDADAATYTHILYLDIPLQVIFDRRQKDSARARPPVSVEHLHKWQLAEKTELRRVCAEKGILFASLSTCNPVVLSVRAAAMLADFRCHTEESNLSWTKTRLDTILTSHYEVEKLQTVLVLDADRTLAPDDTGAAFWKAVYKESNPLKALFGGPLRYSYTAFRQATLLYEEQADEQNYNAICERIASSVRLYPEMVSMLKHVGEHDHVAAVVVTCGLRRVWELVLAREGLSKVRVVGGGRLADGFVVTADVKAEVVRLLKSKYNLYTWVFGDGPLDLPMLQEAHKAIVVVGEEQARSKTMDALLSDAVDKHGLCAHQVLLPQNVTPRLDKQRLPLLQLSDPQFRYSLIRERRRVVMHATECNGAKILATATRNAAVQGPALRDAHRRVGWYLATEFLADFLGVEEYNIPHVQGKPTTGHRVLFERVTTIVALMRGGAPMAEGVNDVLPLAMFVHAHQPEDLKADKHLAGQRTVVLVDSVVNNGTTVAKFVRHIRGLDPRICIVVVAGVVQKQSVLPGNALGDMLERDRNLSLIALRLSGNKFTGTGSTDTGNRLFNTTLLD
ncbi:hypothetical protein N656DRAFT_792774 [Canariomyces notabilis]|uniref:Phosphoribosyltransferase domain-containing protein n=1 Tax=Canariomyces notabilis TaxID=2074819 RepID=A0AAN6QEB2_9PEZI|nr:hypothetical protein N656DRAFT_792774 [Canariomyces arenarius]